MNIPAVSQRDPRWAKVLLGFNTLSEYTIGNYGCLITCLSCVSSYYGFKEDPKTINDKLKKEGGFASGGLYIYGSLPKIHPIKEKHVKTPKALSDSQIKEIKDSITMGYPVMAEIDYNPTTLVVEQHFILLIAFDEKDENNFTMMDPWTGSIGSLKFYLKGLKPTARKSIESYTIYSGEVPVVDTCEASLKECRSRVGFLEEAIRELEVDLELCVADKKSLDDTLKKALGEESKLRDSLSRFSEDNTELAKELSLYEKLAKDQADFLISQKKEIDDLKIKLEEGLEAFKTPEIIALAISRIIHSKWR